MSVSIGAAADPLSADSRILFATVPAVQPSSSPEDLQPGSAIGPYDLVVPLGEGGMAKVWAARVRGRTDLVALKILLPELAENEEFRKMFFDEAEIASRVRHPNVCTTYELGEHEGTLYIAMEYLDGGSLMRVLRPGREDVSEVPRLPIRARIAARIIADACAGLHAAHELRDERGVLRNVVHRDVSPHNLLITQAGEVKVTDFGVAKALGKSQVTIAGQLKGKLAYMAPEQLVGGAIDRRCDVFALGTVLYEITVGERPFQGEHDPQIMAAIMLGRMDPPSKSVAGYPKELEAIVLKALANEPAGRFASAEEMRLALEKYLKNSGPAITPAQIAALVMDRCRVEIEGRALALGLGPTHPRVVPPPAIVAPPVDPRAVEGARLVGEAGAWPERGGGGHDSGRSAMSVARAGSGSQRGMIWLVVAALLGALIGVVVLGYVRNARRARAADQQAAQAAASAHALASALATTSSASSASSLPGASASDTRPTAPRSIRLHVVPSSAVVIVDEVVLPPGTTTVTRPADGKTLNVLVRAEHFQDTIVLVDSATPDDVDVALEPLSAPAKPVLVRLDGGTTLVDRRRDGGGRPPGQDGQGGQGDKSGDKNGGGALETPPNPYE